MVHFDVNVPPLLQGRVGQLLWAFGDFLAERGMATTARGKPTGGHVTPWWLYLSLNAAAPRRSRIQFGETTFTRVNNVPHMWVRGKPGSQRTTSCLRCVCVCHRCRQYKFHHSDLLTNRFFKCQTNQ